MSALMFVLSTIALALVSATMLARANDLRWKKGLTWHVRLLGFVFTGFAPFGIVTIEYVTGDWPNVYECFFRVGLSLVFLTTPYLPPWWKWISGRAPEEHPHRRRSD